MASTSSNCRIETGYERGDTVSPHYDPMLAKLIAWGEDRDKAIDRLAEDLDRTTVWPVRSNSAFLFAALDHQAFRQAKLDTGFIARHANDLVPPPEAKEKALVRAAQSFANEQDRYTRHAGWTHIGPRGLRLNRPPKRSLTVYLDGEIRDVDWPEERSDAIDSIQTLMGNRGASDGAILSPMPGKIIAVNVARGSSVAKGDKLVTLEAMKMEHSLEAPFDGIISMLNVREGEQVSEGSLLVQIDAAE